MIIKNLLDTDLYKITMLQCYYHKFPTARAVYAFKCRNQNISLVPYQDLIKQELSHLAELRFTDADLEYLAKLRFIKHDFIEFLRGYRLNTDFVKIYADQGELKIRIDGPIIQASMFEIYLLAIANEIYFRETEPEPDYVGAKELLQKKLAIFKNTTIKFADFGTRRRRSCQWQGEVLEICKNILPDNLIGTSNIYFARKYGIKPIGTMAHEFLQATQAMVALPDSQSFAFKIWAEEYQGDLGIALSDVWGMDAFLVDFNRLYAKTFDGARHDSGDPFIWCEKLIKHYEKLGINPLTKTAVFSDGLDFPKAKQIYDTFADRINISFGIGTNLTNDFPNSTPLNIVIKMIECNGWPVAKVSDSPGKMMCEQQEFMNYLLFVIEKKISEPI
jgi:nicotinate phosphoribosyltransferase